MKKIYLLRKIVRTYLFILLVLFAFKQGFSQSILITDNESYTADTTAMLDVMSTTKGLLIPRLTSDQRNAIDQPAMGLLVFDTNETAFYFYDGASWINLSKGQIWSVNSNYVILSNETGRVGIGTFTPNSKLEVKADSTFTSSDTLFAVKDQNGNIVFAVFPDGAKVYVNNGVKGSVGGFAVTGRNPTKADLEEEYLMVTPDSTRIWVTESTKASVGGFAVTGRNPTKGTETGNYLSVTKDSTRIYVTESLKGSVGGFAVTGRNPTKGAVTDNYLEVTKDSTRIYVTESTTKGSVGGFAVTGRNPTKGAVTGDYFNVSGNVGADIVNNEKRMMWYPQKAAFLAGEVHVGSSDSVGMNSTAIGYRSISKGNYSQAMGYQTKALAVNSTAFGNYAVAFAPNSFAMGDSAIAKGIGSFAIGSVGRKPGGASTGKPTTAMGMHSVSIGMGAYTDTIGAIAIGNDAFADGIFSNAYGYGTQALGEYSTALGYTTVANGDFSTALGYETVAFGYSSTALGYQSVANGSYAVSLGYDCVAGAFAAFAAGEGSIASGQRSTAIGSNNFATNNYATAMGVLSEASGYSSIAAGQENIASGNNAIAIGFQNSATGNYSYSLGERNIASGLNSYAFGQTATSSAPFAVTFARGIETSGDYSFTIGLKSYYGTNTNLTADNTFTVLGGRVGIGVVAPTDTMEIAGNLNLNDGIASGTALSVNNADAIYFNGTYFGWGTGSYKNYFAGDVGLGLSNPTIKLHIKQNDSNAAIRIVEGGIGNTDYWDIGHSMFNHLLFSFNGTSRAQINNANGSYTSYSDKSLKKNITELGSVLDKVIQLKPSKFHFKEEPDNQPKSLGFIAQDVELLFPDIVKELDQNGKTYKALVYDDFAILSVQAIIDLNKKLENEVNKLKSELDQKDRLYEDLLLRIQKIEESINNE